MTHHTFLHTWRAKKDVIELHSSNIWLLYIHSRLFTTSWVYLETTQWPAPSWLVSSVGRALHRYRKGREFKSRTGLNINFRPSFQYCLSRVHYCEDLFHIHVFIRSSNIWLSYIQSQNYLWRLLKHEKVIPYQLPDNEKACLCT